jgi:N-acetylglucosamine-6-phosphate deacetylase
MSDRYRILNGQVILPDRIIPNGCVLVEGGRIAGIESGDAEFSGATDIDAAGLYISPGFIDIHVHGGGGYDFMDGTEKAFLGIARIHALHGTTSMLPTTLTAEKQDLMETLAVFERVKGMAHDGANFMGMHLEGPYFSMQQRGAQDPRFIRDPDPEEYLEILAHSPSVRRWSAAPERKGAIEFGRELVRRGILPSMAHTDAIYEEALEAYVNGYTLLTHFYSAMSGVTRRNAFRYAGVVEAGYLHDGLDVEIIADGVHLPPPLLQLICKIKGPDRTALITDAMRGACMPEGESHLGTARHPFPVIVEDGVAKLPDRSAFAGSVATADRLVRTMLSSTDLKLEEVIRMISSTPARIMKVDDRTGSLKKGLDADIVLFDAGIGIRMTMVRGRIVHRTGL